MNWTTIRCSSLAALLLCAAHAQAAIRITEWSYQSSAGEHIELTNMGQSSVDMTGWSYDDDSRLVGGFDLGPLGVMAPGESAILTEGVVQDFRDVWGLAPEVKVIGPYINNLGRADEINIFDHLGGLVDRLTYGDQTFVGTIRTQNASGNPFSPAVLDNDTVGAPGDWVLATVGDRYGSYMSLGGDIGNPGVYVDWTAVPEPASAFLALLVVVAAALPRRRR